jgi:hypothetical protein
MEGQAQSLNILRASYGAGDCAIDVTERLQGLVKNGVLNLVVSNALFTDPCPNKVKELQLVCELPGSAQFHFLTTRENKRLLLPRAAGKKIGIFYTNNAVPLKYLDRVLQQLKKAAQDVDIITCPWKPIEANPFPEIPWNLYEIPHHMTMTLQILKLLYTADDLGGYETVFFLEHDVLYPEGYFDIEPLTQDVLANSNYIGLCEKGFQSAPKNMPALHLLAMRLPAAIEHFTANVSRILNGEPAFMIEPVSRAWTWRKSTEPIVHINHGNHFSIYHSYFSKDHLQESHPYWGSAASWWE